MSDFIQSPLNKQRKDKFLMVIPTPTGLRDIASKFNRAASTIIPDALTLSIYGAITPDVIVPAVQARYSGQTLKVSSHARDPYSPQIVNFTVDNRFNNYWYIYKWLSILNDDKNSTFDESDVTGLRHMTEKAIQKYSTQISIFALDEYEKRVMEFIYTLSFPTTLGGIHWSNRDAGELETTLTFEYSQFFAKPVEQVENL